MKSRIARRTQIARVAACALILNFSVPGGAIAVYGGPLRENVAKGLADRAKAAKALIARRAKSASRLLTAKEEGTLQGRAGENPYIAGSQKYETSLYGVSVLTGNYSTTATDLSFDGGYGIPVNVTRSYSANNPDEGPFGKGWTLSADVRSTAGGLLKSAGGSVRSVPGSLQERPSQENDPNVAIEPAAAVSAIDAGGKEETVQKDVDGILTTPPWDKNVYDSVYEWVEFPAGSGQKVQVLVSNSVKTPDGTVYTYAKQGSYPNGTRPWNDSSVASEAANILKVTSATDRQGNVTTYAYGSAWIDFAKANGTVREHPLVGVAMPNGHTITFVWGNGSPYHPANRVWKVSDNDAVRTVVYDYNASGLLAKVTTPGLKATTYGYAGVSGTYPYPQSPPVSAQDLLTTITDPRGLTTSIEYVQMPYTFTTTYYVPGDHSHTNSMPSVRASAVHLPNGTTAAFRVDDAECNGGYALYNRNNVLQGCWRYAAVLDGTRIYTSLAPVPSSIEALLRGGMGWDTHAWGVFGEQKTYDANTLDMVEVRSYNTPLVVGKANERGLNYWPLDTPYRLSTIAYNFMGQKLRQTDHESVEGNAYTSPGSRFVRETTTDYAYWGADKYYQQKAVRDGAGRYSFTDYYPKSDVAGKRGQTSRVYAPKYTQFSTQATAQYPAPPLALGQTQADYDAKVWKYTLHPVSDLSYAAEFTYDAQGRPIEVKKLQKTSTSPWSYVVTHTTYGGEWGQASEVVEDYGTGKINRTTQTLDYTTWGKPCDVIDAAGRQFHTNFDLDGLVLSVTRVDNGANQTLVSYTYGTSGLENGQPMTVTDGLSGVVQSIAYVPAGTGAVGLPASVTETNGSDVYSVAYAYDAQGDRTAAAYATPNGTTRWGYRDYAWVGFGVDAHRAFQTMVRLDAAGNPTPEEFHYAYDLEGRLHEATFAQTPQAGFVPAAGQSYYDASHQAQSRARAHYEYDASGRTTLLAHWWDAQGQSSVQIAQNACAYEMTGLKRGLKTSSSFAMQGETARTETYGYDPLNDQITEAHYGDAGTGSYSSPDETWGYDAAGNRSGNTCDNLNRATVAGNRPTTNDILGNRTSLTVGDKTIYYTWDALNRMTGTGRAGAWSATYGYRADGLRVSKAYTGTGVATRYRYDGQMTIEDVETPASGNPTVTRYGVGARGVDFIERTVGSTVTTGFPIYDAHGNNVATLVRNGTGYSVPTSDLRRYSAWGNVRSANTQGDPKGKYCANLGHRQDDETGFIYMRARYYDTDSGRFLSEDVAHDGKNWFSYCNNNPVNFVDQSGKSVEDLTRDALILSAVGWGLSAVASPIAFACFVSHAIFMTAFFADWQPSLFPSAEGHAFIFGLIGVACGASAIADGATFSWAEKMKIGGMAGHIVATIAEHVAFYGLFMSMEAIVESEL